MRTRTEAPPAQVTLRAYLPAPARVELVYRPASYRLARTVLALAGLWGAIPLLIWVPPHYPWVVGAFLGGLYLAYREWHGRYLVRTFAAICPRCGHPLSLGADHTISLPHALTCYHCHFEPLLEVTFAGPGEHAPEEPAVEHHHPECVGRWGSRWLADEAFLVCDRCNAHARATPAARARAEEENRRGAILARLADEGEPLI